MSTQRLKDTDIDRLRRHAEKIPSLGGLGGIGPYLIQYAMHARRNIVEIGAWRGSNSSYISIGRLLAGAHRAAHHVFDPFSAHGVNKEKAEKQGLILRTDDDLFDEYRKNMKPFGLPIEIHRRSAFDAEWNDPIDLFVDDFGSEAWQMREKIRIFYPHFIPGKTIVILCDYYFHETHPAARYQNQRKIVEANPDVFHFIERAGKSRAAIYMFGKGQIKYPE